MKSLMNRRLVFAVLAMACLTTVLLIVAPTRSGSPGPGEYDPWLDWNDDGKIDMIDISRVAKAFTKTGQSLNKASIEYESDWIDITDKCGQNITVTHNLNSTDLIADIQGKTTLNSGPHQRHYGLTDYTAGWDRTYGGTNEDWATALVQTGDGGYALAGVTKSFGAGSEDFWLVKTDASGTMQWNRTYGGTSYEEAWALVQTGDGGFALAGYTGSFGAGSEDFWLVKTDASGTMQWNKTYGGTSGDGAEALVQTNDGGYALAGYTFSSGAGNGDFWLVKTYANGNMQWNKTYGGTSGDGAHALVQTNDGYALAGYTYSFGAGNSDFRLVKTDAAGNMQWNKTYGGTGFDDACDLVQTTDGGYALAGETHSFGAGNTDSWLVKTDTTGNAQWNRTYGGTNDDYGWALVQTNDGYALAGCTGSFGAGSGDFWLVKTDASGTMQWNKTYGGTSGDGAWALVQTSDGGYALAGETYYSGAGTGDLWLVKTDVESGLAWIDSSANTITLYRGATDTYWNYVRVRLWKPR